MMKNQFPIKESVRIGLWILTILLAFSTITISSGLSDTHTMLFEIMPILLSVIVTAIITSALLERQTTGEEKREKNVQIYSSKLTAYSEFISRMWSSLNGEILDREHIEQLRSEMFNKLIFYFNNEVINALSEKLRELREQIDRIENSNEDDNNDKKAARYRKIFAEITAILRNDINPGEFGADVKTDAVYIRTLWNRIDSFLNEGTAGLPPETPANEMLKNRCFHFNVWGWEYQKSLWQEVKGNLYPLFLCEFGESWRTDFLKKRIKDNDLIFLYRTGGNGYVGLSRARGYVTVVFDGSGDKSSIKCYRHNYSSGETQVLGWDRIERESPEYARKLIRLQEEYNAENTYFQGETAYYSYLYVEPVLLYEEGVGTNEVYRRTISPFDAHSAWIIFSRFRQAVESGRVTDGFVDREKFEALAAENRTALP